MRGKANQKNSEFGHFSFSVSDPGSSFRKYGNGMIVAHIIEEVCSEPS